MSIFKLKKKKPVEIPPRPYQAVQRDAADVLAAIGITRYERKVLDERESDLLERFKYLNLEMSKIPVNERKEQNGSTAGRVEEARPETAEPDVAHPDSNNWSDQNPA